MTCVILGASSTEQLAENLDACQGDLTEEVLKRCDEVWQELRGPIPQYNR